jgi:predicted RND superfamily exporter protein
MSPQYNIRMYFMIIFVPFFLIFLGVPLSESIYAINDFGKKLLSNPSYQNIANENIENSNIPDQFIVYLKEENETENKTINPLDFFNSELKHTGTELLQVYNNVAKGFAIKVPNEKILEELKKNPLVEYIGQDKKISSFKDSSSDSKMKIQVIPESVDKK